MFKHKANRYDQAWSPDTVGIPTLRSHVVVEVGPNYILQERNPYYWKVYPEGNQLPYIDKVYSQIVETILCRLTVGTYAQKVFEA